MEESIKSWKGLYLSLKKSKTRYRFLFGLDIFKGISLSLFSRKSLVLVHKGDYDVEVKGVVSKVLAKTIQIKYDNNTVIIDRATGRQKNTGRKKVYWKPTRF